jgi:hypothetical protein
MPKLLGLVCDAKICGSNMQVVKINYLRKEKRAQIRRLPYAE